MNSMPNLNSADLAEQPLNLRVNELIENVVPPSEKWREYLGASLIGTACARRIQYTWFCDPQLPMRTKDIFARGHFFEAQMRQHLIDAGFKFADPDKLAFSAADELFRGHADGIISDGPQVSALIYPALWECKCLNAKGWCAIERNGLVGLYRVYAAQVAVYQAFLNVTNPALFSVVNADTCERLHFAVPFDAALAQEMSDRALMIIEATKAGELLPRIVDNPDDWRCRMCQWKRRCYR
jgi:hypothetical protein